MHLKLKNKINKHYFCKSSFALQKHANATMIIHRTLAIRKLGKLQQKGGFLL